MILPTMTPQEKHKQMEKFLPHLYNFIKTDVQSYYDRLRKTKKFPTFAITPAIEFEGMGKWHFVIEAESKSSVRKGVLSIRAFQKYYISHSKDPSNIGTGIYLCNPNDAGYVSCSEFPPHYFNRLRKRFIEPKGIVQPSFNELVRRLLVMQSTSVDLSVRAFNFHRDEDGMYTMEHDTSIDKKEGYNNFISYHREGVSLGVCYDGKGYVNFTTFVPNSMLREGQKEMQQKQLKNLLVHQYHQQLNPFATFDKREWIDKDTDL